MTLPNSPPQPVASRPVASRPVALRPVALKQSRSVRRTLLCSLLATLCLLLLPALTRAQSFSRRDISGIVTLDGKIVSNATVFLQDTKTRDVRSFISTANGSFSFAQVGMIDDYQLWAQKDAHKSKTHAISSFDTRTEVHLELKLK